MKLMNVSDDMEVGKPIVGSSFTYSAVRIDKLGASDYTLVTIVVDISGSVENYKDQLLDCVKSVVEACKKSPKSENLLIRLVSFNTNIYEIHGFKLLSTIDVNDYQSFIPRGMTALFDATYSSIGATLDYAKGLIDQFFVVNGIVVVITDGENNASKMSENHIKKQMEQAMTGEHIESLMTILIGVNAASCSKSLNSFKDDAALTQYVDAGDATPSNLAKIATFVSKSISSQSQALNSGGPSKSLTF